jgi:hypothetical protein
MNAPSRIEGYAVVSDNGMIATAKGTMPRALKFDADQEFFERGLNGKQARSGRNQDLNSEPL